MSVCYGGSFVPVCLICLSVMEWRCARHTLPYTGRKLQHTSVLESHSTTKCYHPGMINRLAAAAVLSIPIQLRLVFRTESQMLVDVTFVKSLSLLESLKLK